MDVDNDQDDAFGYRPANPVQVNSIRVSEGMESDTLRPALLLTLGNDEGHRTTYGINLESVDTLTRALRVGLTRSREKSLTPGTTGQSQALDLIEQYLEDSPSVAEAMIASADDPSRLAMQALDVVTTLLSRLASSIDLDALSLIEDARRRDI